MVSDLGLKAAADRESVLSKEDDGPGR